MTVDSGDRPYQGIVEIDPASLALLECFGRGEDRIDRAVIDAVMLELDDSSLR